MHKPAGYQGGSHSIPQHVGTMQHRACLVPEEFLLVVLWVVLDCRKKSALRSIDSFHFWVDDLAFLGR